MCCYTRPQSSHFEPGTIKRGKRLFPTRNVNCWGSPVPGHHPRQPRLNRNAFVTYFCIRKSLLWSSVGKAKPMHRRTARLLLLVALLGTLAPFVQAISADAPHACCLRKKLRCHTSASSSDRPEVAFHSATCGQHKCCSALAVAQRAHPRTAVLSHFSKHADLVPAQFQPISYSADLNAFHSVRAPPVAPTS